MPQLRECLAPKARIVLLILAIFWSIWAKKRDLHKLLGEQVGDSSIPHGQLEVKPTYAKKASGVRLELLLVHCVCQNSDLGILAYENIDGLRERYPEMEDEIDSYRKHQKFDEQIKQVLTFYNPPNEECLLAVHQSSSVGILIRR